MQIFILMTALLACTGDADPESPAKPGVEDTGLADTDPDSEPVVDTDTDLDPDTDPVSDTGSDACVAVVESLDPANGSASLLLDGVFTATFDGQVEETDPWSIAVVEALTGVAISGTSALAADGLSGTFTPDAELTWETEYEVTIEVCGSLQVGNVTTVRPPIDPALTVGRVYGIPVADLQWVEPLVGELLVPTLEQFLLETRSYDPYADTLDLVVAAAYPGPPLLPECIGVMEPPPADFSTNPRVAVGPGMLGYANVYDPALFEDFQVAVQFNADASELLDVRITGLWDPEQLLPGLPCNVTSAVLMGSCVACNTAANGQCIVVDATLPMALERTDIDVTGSCAL